MITRFLAVLSCLFASACGRKPHVPPAPRSFGRVSQIVAEQLGKQPSDVRPDSTFASLGADDLDFVEIVMATEEELKVSINDDSINRAAGVTDPSLAIKSLTIAQFSTLADSAPTQKPVESDEPQDGGLRAAQVGTFAEMSQLPNPRGHELVFIPTLEDLTAMSEQRLGRRLSEAETVDLKSKAAVMAMSREDAAKLREQRLHREAGK